MTEKQVVEAFDVEKLASSKTAERLKDLMQQKGLTISTLAEKAGISANRVENYFNDPMGATIHEMCAICRALEISPNEANGDETVTVSG